MDDLPDVVRTYFDAVNADRFDDLRDVFAADVALEMAGSGRRDGVDAAIGYYSRALAALPIHDDEPVAAFVSADGRRVAVEIEFTGRTTDDRPVVFTAVDLFDLDGDDRVVRLRSLYDTNDVTKQLRPPT